MAPAHASETATPTQSADRRDAFPQVVTGTSKANPKTPITNARPAAPALSSTTVDLPDLTRLGLNSRATAPTSRLDRGRPVSQLQPDLEFTFLNEGAHTWRVDYTAPNGGLNNGDLIILFVRNATSNFAIPGLQCTFGAWCAIPAITTGSGGSIRVPRITHGSTYCFFASAYERLDDGRFQPTGTYLGDPVDDCRSHQDVVTSFADATPPDLIIHENGQLRANPDWRSWSLAKWGPAPASYNEFGAPTAATVLDDFADVVWKCRSRVAGAVLVRPLGIELRECAGFFGEHTIERILATIDDGTIGAAIVIGFSKCVVDNFGQLAGREALDGLPDLTEVEAKAESRLILAACVGEIFKTVFETNNGVHSYEDWFREMFKTVGIDFLATLIFTGGNLPAAGLVALWELIDYLRFSDRPPILPHVSAWFFESFDGPTHQTVSASTANVLIQASRMAQARECECTNPPSFSNLSTRQVHEAVHDWLRYDPDADLTWARWSRIFDRTTNLATEAPSIELRARQAFPQCHPFSAIGCNYAVPIKMVEIALETAVGNGFSLQCHVVDDVWIYQPPYEVNEDWPFYCAHQAGEAGDAPTINDWRANSTTSMTFGWSAVTDADSYQLGSCAGTILASPSGAQTSGTWNGMSAGQDHCVQVRALVDGIAGAWSPSETVRPPAEPMVTDAPPSGTVRLRNRHFNKCVQVMGTSTGSSVEMLDCNNAAASQQFTFEESGQGTWMIKNTSTNRCLGIQDWRRDNNAPVELHACDWQANSKWHVLDSHGAFRELRPQHNPSACLDTWVDPSVRIAKQYQCHTGGTLLNQDWALEAINSTPGGSTSGGNNPGQTAPAPGHVVHLKAEHSGKCATVDNLNSAWQELTQQNCDGADTQRFVFSSAGEGYLRLQTAMHNHCVEVRVDGSGSENGRDIRTAGCQDAYRNEWELVPASGGAYEIRVRRAPGGTRYCMDVAGVSTNAGARLHNWECHGGANQRWFLESPPEQGSTGGGSLPTPSGLWWSTPTSHNGQIDFHWTGVDEAQWYEVRYRLAAAPYGPDSVGDPDWQIFPGNTTSATATGTHSGAHHCWVVQAHNSEGPLGTAAEQCGVYPNGSA